MFMPIVAIWMTCIALPVWHELRYVLGIYVGLSIILGAITEDTHGGKYVKVAEVTEEIEQEME